MLREVKEKLKLTPDQEKQMKSIRMKYAKDLIQLRATLQTKRLELKEIVDTEKPDRALIEKKFREIGDLQVQQKLIMFDQGQEMKMVLTPDQQKMAKELREERIGGRMGMRRGMMQRRGWRR